jgi:hypothetical protein
MPANLHSRLLATRKSQKGEYSSRSSQLIYLIVADLDKIHLQFEGRKHRWGALFLIVEISSLLLRLSSIIIRISFDCLNLWRPTSFKTKLHDTRQLAVLNWKEQRFENLIVSFCSRYCDSFLCVSRFKLDKNVLFCQLKPLSLTSILNYLRAVLPLTNAILAKSKGLHFVFLARQLVFSYQELYNLLCLLDLVNFLPRLQTVIVVQDCFFADSLTVSLANVLGLVTITLQHGDVSSACARSNASIFACRDVSSFNYISKLLPPSTLPSVYDYSLLSSNHELRKQSWTAMGDVVYFDTHPSNSINFELWSFLKSVAQSKKVLFKFRPGASFQRRLSFYTYFFPELVTGRIVITNHNPENLFQHLNFLITYCSSALFECQRFNCTPIMVLPSNTALASLPDALKTTYTGVRVFSSRTSKSPKPNILY